MIEVSNLRVEDVDDKWARAVVDIRFEGLESPYAEDTIWFATRKEDCDKLPNDCYDAFFLVPLYLAMYHGQDLHICGTVSKRHTRM